MNYQLIYENLMNRAKQRQLNTYTEKHHIKPRCMGGTDDATNIVELTAKEHYMAHRLLTEIYPKNRKLKYAYWMMCTMETEDQNRHKVSARIYEYAKSLISTRSEETKQKIAESLKQAYKSGKRKTRKGVKMPKSFGDAISKAKKGMVGTNTGIPWSDKRRESQQKSIEERKQAGWHNDDTRKKISQTLLSKPELTCPHCNKSSRGTAFKFYHFDSCKFKK